MAYTWSGIAIMWAFWLSFVIFLASPRKIIGHCLPSTAMESLRPLYWPDW